MLRPSVGGEFAFLHPGGEEKGLSLALELCIWLCLLPLPALCGSAHREAAFSEPALLGLLGPLGESIL